MLIGTISDAKHVTQHMSDSITDNRIGFNLFTFSSPYAYGGDIMRFKKIVFSFILSLRAPAYHLRVVRTNKCEDLVVD